MNDTVVGVAVGAVVTTLTGIAGSEYCAWRERMRERKAIRASLSDELLEIQTIINNMNEVWSKTGTLIPSYVQDLRACFTTYDAIRQRLFLVKSSELRSEIIKFYKDLKNTISTDGRRAGSLSKAQESNDEQKELASRFIKFGERATEIISKLK